MKALLVHWPHIVPVLLAFGAVIYLWIANRRWRAEEQIEREGVEPCSTQQPNLAEPDNSHTTVYAAANMRGSALPLERHVRCEAPHVLRETHVRRAAPRVQRETHVRGKTQHVRRVEQHVRREAARRGALVLGPILAAISTGAVIYGLNLAATHVAGGLIWIHLGFSLLVCLLVIYKLAELDRHKLGSRELIAIAGSTLLALLLVPLLLSGIALLISPSSTSYFAYLHLSASAWWTLLVVWHLMRYLKRSLRTLRSAIRG